jgi:hypothetical protein
MNPGDRSEPECRRACKGTAKLGYQIIEIPLLDPSTVDAAMTKRVLAEFNLKATTSLSLTFDADVSSPDNECAARGKAAPPRIVHIQLYTVAGNLPVGRNAAGGVPKV